MRRTNEIRKDSEREKERERERQKEREERERERKREREGLSHLGKRFQSAIEFRLSSLFFRVT